MTPIPNQPAAPAEGALNEIEQLIDAEQPLGLWPHNQNSNYGMVRKVIGDQIQSAVDTLSDLYDETFVDTALGYLGVWERELGLPRGTTQSTSHRRTLIHSRRSIAPFTRSRRKATVERFLLDTITGESTAFSSSGIPLTAGGVTLYSGAQSMTGLYRIYENISNFSYDVRIKNTVTPDIAGLLRELNHITPSGISLVLDNTPANVLKWDEALVDLAPNGWWQLGADYNDYSGYANHGVVTGAPASIASPGLLPAMNGATQGARNFSGAGQYVTIPYSTKLDSPRFTMAGLICPNVLPSSGNESAIYSLGAGGATSWTYVGMYNIAGVTKFSFRVSSPTASVVIRGTTTVVGAQSAIYHVAATFDGTTARLYVNGVKEAEAVVPTGVFSTGSRFIGALDSGSGYESGMLDEIIYLDYVLPDAKILEISNTSKNTP
jgi:hypothetical protein